MKIAILDDDSIQTDLACQILTSSGYICQPFQSGTELMAQLDRESYDMVILDWQVADLSGLEVLRWIRGRFSKTIPIMFITSHSEESAVVEALAAGADDYIFKPIRRSELVARVQALLRRAYPLLKGSGQIIFDDYMFDTRAGRLTIAGKPIDIAQKEFDLALLFFENMNRALSRAYILEEVWSRNIDLPSRTLDTHVSRVRIKLQLNRENGYRITPVFRYGYCLEKLVL